MGHEKLDFESDIPLEAVTSQFGARLGGHQYDWMAELREKAFSLLKLKGFCK